MKTSEILLFLLLVIFGYVSFIWIKSTNSILDASSITALATIVYAIFTFFMFRSMKDSSEAQIRPLLITTLNETMDFGISNKMNQNEAKNVKVYVRAIPFKKKKINSKFKLLLNKYSLKRVWNFLQDSSKSHKENFEILDNYKSIKLSDYLIKTLPFKKNVSDWGDVSIKGKTKNGELNFKLLVYISYESLLDIEYELNESYLVNISPKGTTVEKNWDNH